MSTAKHIYETTFIVNASIDDAQIEAAITRTQDIITKNGGNVTSLNKWGRKRLAYPINKKTTGFYCHIEFEADAPLIALLERAYQLDELILRYLTVRLSRNALKARAKALREAVAAEESVEATTPTATEEKGALS
ncbi:MAG: 30S ribosomal protein S6 [Ignavibacteria bacterium]|nr:30S ribosomal protein S6 [Ignavibacteria bacterium]